MFIQFMANGYSCLFMFNVVKTMSQTTHDWEWLKKTTYKNGEDWGMVHGIVLPTFFMFIPSSLLRTVHSCDQLRE